MPGVSENIRVRSIVGRFLEHPRVFCFGNDGASELYCRSADWMERNFFRRVEIAFPVREQTHRDRICAICNSTWRTTPRPGLLGRDGSYTHCERGDEAIRDAQASLLARYAAGSAPVTVAMTRVISP